EGDRVRIDPGDQADGGAAIDGEADEVEAAIGTVGDASASRCEEDVRVPDRGACPAGDLLERGEARVVGEVADDFDPPGRADAKDEERPVVLGAFEAEGDDGAFGEAPVPRELEGMRLEPSGERVRADGPLRGAGGVEGGGDRDEAVVLEFERERAGGS